LAQKNFVYAVSQKTAAACAAAGAAFFVQLPKKLSRDLSAKKSLT
jgi:hypothetical protein